MWCTLEMSAVSAWFLSSRPAHSCGKHTQFLRMFSVGTLFLILCCYTKIRVLFPYLDGHSEVSLIFVFGNVLSSVRSGESGGKLTKLGQQHPLP